MATDKEIYEHLADACAADHLAPYLRGKFCAWCKSTKGMDVNWEQIRYNATTKRILASIEASKNAQP
jgi:hypothetical protein